MKGRRKKMATTWDGTAAETMIPNRDAEGVLEQALEEYWHRICAVLYRLVGDWDEAEDLALEVFYRLHRRPPRDVEKVASWLYRVATNLGYNAIRARRRRRQYEESAGALQHQRTVSQDPEREVERHEARQRVREVLSGMRPRFAQLLVLRHLGFSYAELAEALGIAPGSIGTLLARAERAFEAGYLALEGNDATLE